MVIPVILAFLGFSLPQLYDTAGYKYLLQYEPDVVSYEDLSLRISGGGYFLYSEYDDVTEYSSLSYLKRYYSHKIDYLLSVNPFQSIYKYDEDRMFDIGISLSGYGKYYPIPNYFFGSLGGKFRSIFRRDSLNQSSISGEFTAGVGIGRIIPLSPMDKALRIEQELMELGVISNPLFREDIKRIADQIGKKEEYNDPRDFWRELESSITKSEQIEDNRLGAVLTIRIRNIIKMPSFSYRKYKRYPALRCRGFEGEIYGGYLYRNPFPSLYYKKVNKNFIGVRFDYSHPLSVRLQFTFSSIGELFLLESLDLRQATIKSDLTYEVLNRLFTTWEIEYSRRDISSDVIDYIEIWESSLECRYFIEYKMSVFLKNDLIYSPESREYKFRLSTGFNYYFL